MSVIVNVDGYISELPPEAKILEFRSGPSSVGDRIAGTFVARDANGDKIGLRHIAAEFNLPQKPWWQLVAEAQA